ncbi:MAG: hypothetical protein ACFE8E_01420 [Candidatus Hodarchaeota archaeon]
MSSKSDRIKLSKWLLKELNPSFPHKEELIEIIETIAEATIPIRGLLERGITSREIEHRLNITNQKYDSKNVFKEIQIHEDILTHSIILKALTEGNTSFSFIASEESEPVLGEGVFGITIDPVDGSTNVSVNRTVGTIVGIYNEIGKIVCGFYVLYGIFTNLVIAINDKVAEFILDTSSYSMTFYHYVFQELKSMPNEQEGGIRCIGGDSNQWNEEFKKYEKLTISHHLKDRYSGSFVGDIHAIINYGGVYAYFPSPKPKIRVYYEWLPLAFIIKTLAGEFLAFDSENKVKYLENLPPLKRNNVKQMHTLSCGGIIGSEKIVNLYLSI